MAKNKTQANFSAQIIKLGIYCSLLLLGCQPLRTDTQEGSDNNLPRAVVQITHEVRIVPVDTGTPATPTATLLPPPNISDLANELFSGRLIERIVIPALRVDSAVTPVGWRTKPSDNEDVYAFEWDSPGPDVGWVITSALPDETGNILLYGHNNMFTEVFKLIGDIKKGDNIYLYVSSQEWKYKVQQVIKIPIFGASKVQREDYKKYLEQTQDQRVTLISCWPPISNTHRIVVIAKPDNTP